MEKLNNGDIKKFLNSHMTEDEFYKIDTSSMDLITLEEYLECYKEKQEQYKKLTAECINAIKEKNKWVRNVDVFLDQDVIEFYNVDGPCVFITKNGNGKLVNYNMFREINNSRLLKDTLLNKYVRYNLSREVKNNSKDEIAEIYKATAQSFGDEFLIKTTVSDNFCISHTANSSTISTDGENGLHSVLTIFTDEYPMADCKYIEENMFATSDVFNDGSSMKVNEEKAKQFIKQICIIK